MNAAGKRRHIESGLCRECSRPATVGHCCDIHAENNRRRMLRVRQRQREQGLCLKCAAVLHPEMDEDYVDCIFCREGTRVYRKESYAVIHSRFASEVQSVPGK